MSKKLVFVMHKDRKAKLRSTRLHFRHLNDGVKKALFDGFGGNMAGSVRWFHVISGNGAIRHVQIMIVNVTPGFIVE